VVVLGLSVDAEAPVLDFGKAEDDVVEAMGPGDRETGTGERLGEETPVRLLCGNVHVRREDHLCVLVSMSKSLSGRRSTDTNVNDTV
jgi:hypothetical protein